MHKWLPNLVAKFWLPNLVLYQTVQWKFNRNSNIFIAFENVFFLQNGSHLSQCVNLEFSLSSLDCSSGMSAHYLPTRQFVRAAHSTRFECTGVGEHVHVVGVTDAHWHSHVSSYRGASSNNINGAVGICTKNGKQKNTAGMFTTSNLYYEMHLSRQQNWWSVRCSWSIACHRCYNYIFILDLTPANPIGWDTDSALI